MEYDKELVERALRIWGFSLENIDIDKLLHVPMHGYKVAMPDKHLLFVENLQCCVALYAYGNNFAFLAHVNTVVLENDEYLLDKDGNPIYFKCCEDLLIEILKFKGAITEPFKIGISFGYNPLSKDHISIKLIEEELNKLIMKLSYLGIPAIKLDDINRPEFIIDANNNSMVFPNQERKTRL